MFTVHFTVCVEPPFAVLDDESLFVVGSHEKIGNWCPNNALKLKKKDDGKFTGTIDLDGVNILKFRYFIGYYLESERNKLPQLIISKWETHLTPRCLMPAVEACKNRVCRANVNDIFGFCGGKTVVSDGWLLNEDENQILLTVTGTAFKFYKSRHIEENYRIKIVPLDLRKKYDFLPNDDDDDNVDDTADASDETLPILPSHSKTEIAALTNEDSHFRDQSYCGESFKNSVDYLVFRTRCIAVEYLGFRMEVYSATKKNLIAVGYAVPSTLLDTFGQTSVPLLTTKGLPVGKIYFRYLFVRALQKLSHPQTMSASFARHWKKRTTLEVGHRGMGNSYTKCAVARENTLHSLNSAAHRGADFVEFDVQLTKNKIPIVYHDFHVMVTVAKRTEQSIAEDLNKIGNNVIKNGYCPDASQNSVDFYKIAVKDLDLSQLKLLHLDHVKHQHEGNEKDIHKVTGTHDEAEEHRPFPTLTEAFQNVSEEVGFNIEIKYPMLQMDGENECENYFERNEFLDIILRDVFSFAGNRRIVFSSFEPDICTMISLKQNKYPVLFLCMGDTKKHVPFVDERTRTSMTAVKFAIGMGLLGVNFNSEDVLRDPTPILKAKEYRLVTFVWGDELADKENVTYFKKTLLVEGVIYDRIGEGEERSNVFTLEKQMKAALFSSKKKSSPVTPPRSISVSHLNQQCQTTSHNGKLNQSEEKLKPKEWPQANALRETLERKIRRISSLARNISKEKWESGANEFKKTFGMTSTSQT